MKILIVDDDADLRSLIAFALKQAGYLVVEAGDGEAALERFAQEEPALVILDVNLPRLDGFEVCRRLRETSRVPVLLLTVRSGEEDVVQGLDLGADDHLGKPFSPRTLLARVRALLRRAGMAAPEGLSIGDWLVDLDRQAVTVGGRGPIRLTRLELRLLQLLIANRGTVLPPERLLSHVWGARGGGDRQLLKQLVHRLRQKIEQDAAEPKRLVTVAGAGYCLDPDGG